MLAFREVPLGAPLKFLVVSVVAVPVCFAVGYALTRLPGVRRVV
jgi:glucans biosynthesis protein C